MSGRVLFDVTGLLHWYAYFRHPSGVQRVSEKLFGAISADANVEYVARVLGGDSFYRLDAETFLRVGRQRQARPRHSTVKSRLRSEHAKCFPAELRKDVRLYHLPYVALGLARLNLASKSGAKDSDPKGGSGCFLTTALSPGRSVQSWRLLVSRQLCGCSYQSETENRIKSCVIGSTSSPPSVGMDPSQVWRRDRQPAAPAGAHMSIDG